MSENFNIKGNISNLQNKTNNSKQIIDKSINMGNNINITQLNELKDEIKKTNIFWSFVASVMSGTLSGLIVYILTK